MTDEQGYATVTLPEWFEALNRDYRYQLTVIDSEDAKSNQFVLRTSAPLTKVSWQITGVRQDAFANANRIRVEVEKGADERGLYLHPQAWGLPDDMGIDCQRERAAHERPDVRKE